MIEEVKRLIRSSPGNRAKEGTVVDFIQQTNRMIYRTKPASLTHSLRLLNANSNVKQKP